MTEAMGCWLMTFWRNVRPSMRGISTSSVMTSGPSCAILSAARSGSLAVPMTSRSLSDDIRAERTFLTTAESSTTNTFIFLSLTSAHLSYVYLSCGGKEHYLSALGPAHVHAGNGYAGLLQGALRELDVAPPDVQHARALEHAPASEDLGNEAAPAAARVNEPLDQHGDRDIAVLGGLEAVAVPVRQQIMVHAACPGDRVRRAETQFCPPPG